MPQPGYGQYPINQSVSISEEQRRRIDQIAAEKSVSLATAMRYLLDEGIKAHDAQPRGRDVLFSGPRRP